MVRGRRKASARNRPEFQCGTGCQDDILVDAPKIKDSKLEFQGKLSHASPLVKEARITKYFHQVHGDENNEKVSESSESQVLSEDLEGDPCLGKTVEISAFSKVNTPHKIQLHDVGSPLSPSTALSRLRISSSPKKAIHNKVTKSRRRLIVSQSQNQIQAGNLKPVCCNVPIPKSVGNTTLPPPTAVNHKLTEYFPVRRSERKPKRTILEEQQRDLEEAVLSGKEEGIEVQHFIGKGRGVVATRHFAKGEFVVEYAGELISMAEAREREKKYAQDQNTGCYMYYFKHHNQQYCVDATAESGRMGRLVNHSRNGNLTTKTVVINSLPHLVLIAKEDIHPSEEVLYDYGDRSKDSLKHHPWLAL
ncbi:N-lysine methyltransferase KMT5A-A isoform X2 [Ischnura elegans]|uniref:N-lysine methyltransferase KMT5A-A isoform X2 n=1 Tax=Ischnura elegans TaxID=197161 RepID=UPI001ED89B54|nr:N-lysine methyltransferase KMT5A-A isoform X2 [Ischnura elegans]